MTRTIGMVMPYWNQFETFLASHYLQAVRGFYVMSNSIYYNYKKLLSYQATLNFIIGERGVGKTYGLLKYFTERYLKTGDQFIYLRRYQSEIDEIGNKLFNYHIKNNEFGDDNVIGYSKEAYTMNGEPFCFMKPLTKEGHIKSVPMPNVKYIIYDEFLITNRSQHYIPREPTQLLSFIDSVYRERDPHVFMLGNASTQTNPYFDFFNLKLPYKSEFATFKDGLILVNYIQNKAYRDHRSKTKFGRLISGTTYGDYAINNQFLDDDHSFIAKKTPKSWLFACLYIERRNYGLWIDSDTCNMYISKSFDPKNPRCFAITPTDHTELAKLATVRSSPWFKKMIECYRYNQLFFENINIKNYVMKAIRPYL